MGRGHTTVLALTTAGLLTSGAAGVPDLVAYRGKVRLPMDLYTGDGARVERGLTEVEIRREKQHYLLFFIKEDRLVAAVNGRSQGDTEWGNAAPIIGAAYLQPAGEPIGTEEERRFSSTGRSLYEEAKWEWNATLRAYRSAAPEGPEVVFVFQRRVEGDDWLRVTFVLLLRRPASG